MVWLGSTRRLYGTSPFQLENIDISASMVRPFRRNMTPQKRRYTLAIILLAVSLIAVAPTITRADQQTQNGTITIDATGQATPIDKKASCGQATLSLAGSVHTEGNDQLKINSLTGNLQVGSNAYPISNGQGEANKKGKIEINAKSNGNGNHNYELTLHGNMQGNSLTFDSKESKLSSLCFLSLSGQANINVNQSGSSSSSSSTSESETETHSESGAATVTQTVTVTQTLNNNATSTVFSNQTVTQTVNNGTTTTAFNNQTVTQTITQPQNVTITTTQFNNHTITVTATSTVANSTITQTTTTTVANTTITVTTNSTAPPP